MLVQYWYDLNAREFVSWLVGGEGAEECRSVEFGSREPWQAQLTNTSRRGNMC